MKKTQCMQAACAGLLWGCVMLSAQAGTIVPAQQFRMGSLKVVQSAEAGYWVESTKVRPGGGAASSEEGCMTGDQMRAQLDAVAEDSVCDMEIKQDVSDKALIAMHCKIDPSQPAFVMPLDITRLAANHFQVKVRNAAGTILTEKEYRRTRACTPGRN